MPTMTSPIRGQSLRAVLSNDAVETAERKMGAAHKAMLAAVASRVEAERKIDSHSTAFKNSDTPFRGEYEQAMAAERAAGAAYELAVVTWREAQLHAGVESRLKARAARKADREAGKVPDVEIARKTAANHAAALAAEQERHQAARENLAAALEAATSVSPDSSEAKKAISAHAEAAAKLHVIGHRLTIIQAAEEKARIALAEAEHHNSVSRFEEAFDRVAEAGDAFAAEATEAKSKLWNRLQEFNATLLEAHALYFKLPPELRESRSAHMAHKLGELFGSGGTVDVFRAADVATRET